MRFRVPPTLGGLALSLLLMTTAAAGLNAQSAVSGTCKDGTTTSAKTKSGACRGHGGVATWTGATTTTASGTGPVVASAASKSSKHHEKAQATTSPTTSKLAATTGSTAPAQPSITCADGSISSSKTRNGACRGHGGIQTTGASAIATSAKPVANARAATAPASVPATKPAPSAAAASVQPLPATKSAPAAPNAAATRTTSAGATAVCKDGTYSKSKHHSGACAHHGGVSQWLDSTGTTH